MFEMKLSTIITLFILRGLLCALSPFVFACVGMFVYSRGCFNAACRTAGELFHAEHNEIRPTPCSLPSGFYQSNRLAQVISFHRRWVSARGQIGVYCRVEERGSDRPRSGQILRPTNTKLPLTSAHF